MSGAAVTDVGAGRSASEWYDIGDAALRLAEVTRAQQAFLRAVEVDPAHANALYRLGEIAQAANNLDAARELYRRALSVQPAHAGARARLERMGKTAVASQPHEDGPPYQPSGGGVVGKVASFERASEVTVTRMTDVVWVIRVEPRATDGRPTQPVDADLRGRSIRGKVAVGDWVELPARWRPGKKLKQLRNLTTGQEVKVAQAPLLMRAATVFLIGFVVVWLAVLFFVVGRELFFGSDPSPAQPASQPPSQQVPADNPGQPPQSMPAQPVPEQPAPTPDEPTPAAFRLGCSESLIGASEDREVKAGTTIKFVNDGLQKMQLYLQGATPSDAPVEVEPQGSFEATLSDAGKYAYSCTFESGEEQFGSIVMT